MNIYEAIDSLPLWMIFILTLLWILGSSQFGRWRGERQVGRLSEESTRLQSGPAVGAAMGLLAFMLAISFGAASSRLDERRHLVLNEANAIGTAFLRADVLPPEDRSHVRCLLKQYTDERLEFSHNSDFREFNEMRSRAEALQGELWSVAVRAIERAPDPPTTLFLASLNDVIDVHQERVVVGTQQRMPGLFWITLYSLVCITMFMGGVDERLSKYRNVSIISIPIAIAFSLVISLVAILDRPLSTDLVPETVLFDTLDSMAGLECR